jgi:O-antigen ligase
MAVQLIPLPPALWAALPGHGQLARFIDATGGQASWRPLSLTPDLTLASMVGLAVPAAALVGIASLPEARSFKLLSWLLGAALLGALLGIAQLAGGEGSGFYRYAVTNSEAAVGFFANRNHQAIFLVTVWPMLAAWATQSLENPNERRFRHWTAVAGAVALLPMILITGSRAGAVLAAVGLAAGWWLRRGMGGNPAAPSRFSKLWNVLPAVAGVAFVGVAILLSRAEAVERLFATNLPEESRFAYWPLLTRIGTDFFPFGIGFGAFDPIFRFYEPNWALRPTYLNHAHNDVLELFITGGLPAVLVALTFLIWLARRMLGAASSARRSRPSVRHRFALLGGSIIAITLLGSILDYPLRTPLFGMLFAFACFWLAASDNPGQARSQNALRT